MWANSAREACYRNWVAQVGGIYERDPQPLFSTTTSLTEQKPRQHEGVVLKPVGYHLAMHDFVVVHLTSPIVISERLPVQAHLFVHCPFFHGVRDEHSKALTISGVERVLNDSALPVSILPT